MTKFNVGDKIKEPSGNEIYEVTEIDETSKTIPRYKVKNNSKEFWNYCVGWTKVINSDDILRYGEILTDDKFVEDYFTNRLTRIRTILYENQIFYLKMVNGEVVKIKKLTV